ncbi:glycoside hydrolase family 57 protein [Halonatronum saccharophilum]|uniref:glycoside hydrolase family 57 protein n=1 Tax=Halonatronum saccharophilum TaxID=150060 RepID=UPI000488F8F7|nr:1,4-alpha-glucan branching protein domain-containing protein [Halonatronum saccharophilum]
MNKKGFLALVLHSHLPYVRHPEDPYALEEEWLYEAITETYIPLIKVFSNLVRDGVDFKVTLSLSPTLISMLTDSLLQDRYLNHLNKLIELSEKELRRTKGDPKFYRVAKMYNEKFLESKRLFINYNKNLLIPFNVLQDIGVLEIITCSATHGYLPLMDRYPEAVKAQLQVGIKIYEENFRRRPRGIWLPECGYYPGIDRYLWDEGLKYFFVDTHGILNSNPRPTYKNFAPIYTDSGVAAFARDVESSKQVWSAQEGYPGDYNYREFYRDIGYDLDYEYIKDYIHPEGFRKQTGIKYYKITEKDEHKEVYDPQKAKNRANIHAQNFMFNRHKQIGYLSSKMDRSPIIVSPYDTELFGHWWYEGPIWLDLLLRKIGKDDKLKTISPSDYLDIYPINQVATPSLSSWGAQGYNQVWLDSSNSWIYPKLHKITEQMIDLANTWQVKNSIELRVLNQLAREVLLAQSSDWAFIIKTDTMKEYAVRRTKEHLNNFNCLFSSLKLEEIDIDFLKGLEKKNNIFKNIDYKVYQSNQNANYKEVML